MWQQYPLTFFGDGNVSHEYIVANEATELGSEVDICSRIITPRNVGKNSQILRNPLKSAFLTIFGCR